MRILAFLDPEARRGFDAALKTDHAVTFGTVTRDAIKSLRARSADVVVLDPDSLEPGDYDQIVAAAEAMKLPIVVYADLNSLNARRIVQLAERSAIEIVLRGYEDTQVIAHKLAHVPQPSVPAVLLNRAAPRLRPMPEPLQTVTVGLFSNGALPRWVSGLTAASGLGRRTVDRWMLRTRLTGAATLLDVARLARVWEPLVDEGRPVTEVAEQCGYGRVRLLVSHTQRLVGAKPDRLGVKVTRKQFTERLISKLLYA
jgi:AraC-like DNA-binding protein